MWSTKALDLPAFQSQVFFLRYFGLSILPAGSNIFSPVSINNLPQGTFFPQIPLVTKMYIPLQFSLLYFFPPLFNLSIFFKSEI